MTGVTELAEQLLAATRQDRDDAFNRQHALALEAKRAVRAITDRGARRRQQQAAPEVHEAARRFEPEEYADVEPVRSAAVPVRPVAAAADEEDEVPTRWLT